MRNKWLASRYLCDFFFFFPFEMTWIGIFEATNLLCMRRNDTTNYYWFWIFHIAVLKIDQTKSIQFERKDQQQQLHHDQRRPKNSNNSLYMFLSVNLISKVFEALTVQQKPSRSHQNANARINITLTASFNLFLYFAGSLARSCTLYRYKSFAVHSIREPRVASPLYIKSISIVFR